MSRRYTFLALLLIMAHIGVFWAPDLVEREAPIQPAWLSPPPHDDPEGRLALGLKLSLACADVASLELLKGVSDTLAFELLERRNEIFRAVKNEGPLTALQRAHGIGRKKAESLSSFLELEAKCSTLDTYEVWPPADE